MTNRRQTRQREREIATFLVQDKSLVPQLLPLVPQLLPLDQLAQRWRSRWRCSTLSPSGLAWRTTGMWVEQASSGASTRQPREAQDQKDQTQVTTTDNRQDSQHQQTTNNRRHSHNKTADRRQTRQPTAHIIVTFLVQEASQQLAIAPGLSISRSIAPGQWLIGSDLRRRCQHKGAEKTPLGMLPLEKSLLQREHMKSFMTSL